MPESSKDTTQLYSSEKVLCFLTIKDKFKRFNEYKIEIDKKKVALPETIKNIGTYTVDIKLYEGIVAKLQVKIEA